jgi:hypothetical protein
MKNLRVQLLLPAMATLALCPFAESQTPAHAAAPAPDIGGVYWTTTYSPQIQPVGGGMPPYKPEALAQYKKNMAAFAGSKVDEDDRSRSYCLPDGVPRALEDPYPFEIVQVPQRGEIYQLFEINHMIRRIDMQKPLPTEKELAVLPFYAGHSAGHWDGDTLVIETAGYNDTTFLDNSGAPHSDQLRTTERIRKLPDGKTLEDVVTIHDPEVFTKDWQARFLYQARPDLRIKDWNCGEKHRDISQVRGVHAQ